MSRTQGRGAKKASAEVGLREENKVLTAEIAEDAEIKKG